MRIDSRDINDLRPDVKENVRIFIGIMADKGFPVGISSTYRNDEQQAYLYEQGRTRPGSVVTWSKVTTFHGARLAFDIFQNIRGKEWNDPKFWAAADEVLDKMGFSKLSNEKPHAQWSDRGKYSGTQVRSGVLPPPMPKYRDEIAELVLSIQKKYGLNSPDLWISIIKGTKTASKDHVRALFEKFNK